MAISNLTITNEDLDGKRISDIVGDTLVGTPAENKAKFDDYSEVIKTKFNDLIDELGMFLSSSGVGQGDLSDTVKLILENSAEYYVPKLNANNKIESKYIDDASSSVKGLMSAADKTKLDNLRMATTTLEHGILNPPTSGTVYDAIQNVSGIGSDITDYVIEQRTIDDPNLIWTYRKWKSGVAECWGYTVEATKNCPSSRSYGNAFWSETEMYYFPSNLFIGSPAPKVTASVWSHGGLFDIAIDTWSKDFIQFYYYSPKAESRKAGTSFYVIGRWK